jgi:hypothetical protein
MHSEKMPCTANWGIISSYVPTKHHMSTIQGLG